MVVVTLTLNRKRTVYWVSLLLFPPLSRYSPIILFSSPDAVIISPFFWLNSLYVGFCILLPTFSGLSQGGLRQENIMHNLKANIRNKHNCFICRTQGLYKLVTEYWQQYDRGV